MILEEKSKKFIFPERDYLKLRLYHLTKEIVENHFDILTSNENLVSVEPYDVEDKKLDHFFLKVSRRKLLKRNFKNLSLSVFLFSLPDSQDLSNRLRYVLQNWNPENETFSYYLNKTNNQDLDLIFRRIKKLDNSKEMSKYIRKLNKEKLTTDEKKVRIIKYLLSDSPNKLDDKTNLVIQSQSVFKRSKSILEYYLNTLSVYCSTFKKCNLKILNCIENQSHFNNIVAKENKMNQEFSMMEFYNIRKQAYSICLYDDHKMVRTSDGDLFLFPTGSSNFLYTVDQDKSNYLFLTKGLNFSKSKRELKKQNYYRNNLFNHIHQVEKQLRKTLKTLTNLKELNSSSLVRIIEDSSHFLSEHQKKILIDLPKNMALNQLYSFLNKPIFISGVVKSSSTYTEYIAENNGKAEFNSFNQSDKFYTNKVQRYWNVFESTLSTHDYEGKKFQFSNICKEFDESVNHSIVLGQMVKRIDRKSIWEMLSKSCHCFFVEFPEDLFTPDLSIKRLCS